MVIVVDAKDHILGRLATKVAKLALKGERIEIINSESAVISGAKSEVLNNYKQKAERGIPTKGPFIPKMPDRFVRRTIRGMIPYKQGKGKEAYERVICHIGTPEKFKDTQAIQFEDCKRTKLPNYKFVPVKRICNVLGGKYN